MKIKLLFLSLFVIQWGYSQKLKVKYGEVSKEEIKMTSFDKDPEAKAIILFDIGKSVFIDDDNGGFNIRFVRHKRIKIFDKTASEHADITIPYYVDGYGKTEMVNEIKATTYTLTNENHLIKTPLTKDNIFDEQINDTWYQKKFTLPNIQNGSVIDLQYEVETPFLFNLPDWCFQDKIPTVYSEYEVNMIPFYSYALIAKGIEKFDYQNKKESVHKRNFGRYGNYKESIFTYILKDLPAFKDESFITSTNDYIINMDFQLSEIRYPDGLVKKIKSTWPEMNKSLIKHSNFGKYIKSSKRYAKKILEENPELNQLSDKEKAEQIIDYVKTAFQWNQKTRKYTSQSAKDFIKNKTGNSADINLFLIALLNQAGIPTQPVVVSTRDHGKISIDYPFDHHTNDVIALVKTTTPFLTDATRNLLPYNLIPIQCINDLGLIVNKDDEVKWVDLSSKILSSKMTSLYLKINPSTLETNNTISIRNTNYDAYNSRTNFKEDTLKIKDYYEQKIGDINHVKTAGYDNKHMPYNIHLKSRKRIEKIENKLSINPFLNLAIHKNPLTQKERNYPVDFEYLKSRQFQCTFEIPKGYKMTNKLKPYDFKNELVEIHFSYFKTNNNSIIIAGNYRFKKPVYIPEEYTQIKLYIDTIVKYFNQPIVLETL